MKRNRYVLMIASLFSMQSVRPSTVPNLVLAGPGSSLKEIAQTIDSIEQNIEIVRSFGDDSRVQELLILLAYYQNQLRLAQGKSADQLERDNQLLRLTARGSSGEWKEFWKTTALAVGVIAAAVVITPALIFSIKMASDLLK